MKKGKNDLKKFKDRTKRGKRNLIILYSIIGAAVVLIFILLNNFSSSSLSDSNIYTQKSENVPLYTPTPTKGIVENEPPQLDKPDAVVTKVPEFTLTQEESLIFFSEPISSTVKEFVSSMLSLVGRPYSSVNDGTLDNGIGSQELFAYALSKLGCTTFEKEEYIPTELGKLVIGDIAIAEQYVGIYLGEIEGNSVFIVSSNIGSIYSFSKPTVSLCYSKKDNDAIFNGWYPINFTQYYHYTKNTFSEPWEIDVAFHDFTLSFKDQMYAQLTYRISQYILQNDKNNATQLVNSYLPSTFSYYIDKQKYGKYIDSLCEKIQKKAEEQHSDEIYFSISSMSPATECTLASIDVICQCDRTSSVLGRLDYTLYLDGTYLPFNAFTENQFTQYGFTHLNDGDTIISAEESNEYTSETGSVVKTEDGKTVIRGNSFEIDTDSLGSKKNDQ